MSGASEISDMDQVQVVNPKGTSSVVLICEHASCLIPKEFNHLGLPVDVRKSHVVWDPGAIGIARRISERLDAPLVASTVSRLVYDCNRPPDAPDAMPARSEIIDIPGNVDLSAADRADRTQRFYEPFRETVAQTIARTPDAVLVTLHTFTPIFHGKPRDVELGILHDKDTRLADQMLQSAARHAQIKVQRNEPYGPEHGVTHTLREHALPGGRLNVMIEVRNDLVQTEEAQQKMGDMIAEWIADAFAATQETGVVECTE